MSQIGSKITTNMLASLIMMAATLVSLTLSCVPELGHGSIAYSSHKYRNSKVVVEGVPLRVMEDSRYTNENVYIVDFEVQCIFKGGPLPQRIRIQGVGKKSPMCERIMMEKGVRIIAFLNRDNNDNYMAAYVPDPGDEVYEDEIIVVCGITLTYAQGITNETAGWKCPKMLSEEEMDGCISKEPTEAPEVVDERERLSTKSPKEPMTSTKADMNTDSSEDGQEPPYQPVKSREGQGENDKEVKIGDSASKGGEKSENLEATTPGGRAGHTKSSWIVSLTALFLCLSVFVVRA